MTLVPNPILGPVKGEGAGTIDFDQYVHGAMPTRQRRPVKTPKKPIEQFPHFVSLVIDENGQIQFRASSSLKTYKHHILDDAYSKIRSMMGEVDLGLQIQKPLSSLTLPPGMVNPAGPAFGFQANFDHGHLERPPKRQRSPTNSGADCFPAGRPERKTGAKGFVWNEQRTVAVRVDDHDAQQKWFSEAFRAVQQVGCRFIAKVWIKKIHPKKQSTHPYNGAHPRDQPASPNRTRPPYWPQHVIHKEPDHIDRNARTELLVHLIMHTPQPQITSDATHRTTIDAKQLLEALEEKKTDFKPDRWPIVEEIIRARLMVEQFEDGACDGDYMMCLPDFSDNGRVARGETEVDLADNDASGTDCIDLNYDADEIPGDELELSPSSVNASPTDGVEVGVRRQSDVKDSSPFLHGIEQGNPSSAVTSIQHRPAPLINSQLEMERSSNAAQQGSPMTPLAAQHFEQQFECARNDLEMQRTCSQVEYAMLQSQAQTDHRRQEMLLPQYDPMGINRMFAPPGYPAEMMQMHPAMLPRSHAVGDPLALLRTPADIVIGHAHCLPMMENFGYQDYAAAASQRSLAFRSNPSPQPGVMGSAQAEMNMMQERFY